MLSSAIAEQLRRRGHDVVAVTERGDLRALDDLDLFDRMQDEGRAVATYNRDDFLEIDRRRRQSGTGHAGIVILNPRRFPQGQPATLGRLVTSLDTFIASGRPYPSFVCWLQ